MKKFLSAMVAAATIVTPLATIKVSAVETAGILKVETVSGKPGESVDVAVEISNNPGIISVGFTLSYDEENLKLISAEDSKLLPGGDLISAALNQNPPYLFMWSDDIATENHIDNGNIIVFHFDISDTAQPGFSEIAINIKPNYTLDSDINEVDFKAINGGIEIKEEETATTTTEETTTTTKPTTTTTTEETTTTTKPTTTSTTEETTITTEPTTTTTTEETTTTTEPTTTRVC